MGEERGGGGGGEEGEERGMVGEGGGREGEGEEQGMVGEGGGAGGEGGGEGEGVTGGDGGGGEFGGGEEEEGGWTRGEGVSNGTLVHQGLTSTDQLRGERGGGTVIFLMNFRIPRRRITSGRERVGLKKVVIVVSTSKALRFPTSSSPILFRKIFPNCAVHLTFLL